MNKIQIRLIVVIIILIIAIIYLSRSKENLKILTEKFPGNRILIPSYGSMGYRWRGGQVITGDENFY
jgi:hypothetical protein